MLLRIMRPCIRACAHACPCDWRHSAVNVRFRPDQTGPKAAPPFPTHPVRVRTLRSDRWADPAHSPHASSSRQHACLAPPSARLYYRREGHSSNEHSMCARACKRYVTCLLGECTPHHAATPPSPATAFTCARLGCMHALAHLQPQPPSSPPAPAPNPTKHTTTLPAPPYYSYPLHLLLLR